MTQPVAFTQSLPAKIAKGKLGVYFAWGAFEKYDGEVFTDSHGDQIPGDEFVAAALSLAKSGVLGHEHDGTVNGSVPLVMPMTDDIKEALELTGPHSGLTVGFEPVGEMAKSLDAGDLWELSIAGEAWAELVKTGIAKSGEPVEKAEHKRTLRKLKLNEISLVKRGAHGAGTKIAIAKRAPDAPPAGEADVLAVLTKNADAIRSLFAEPVEKSTAGAKKKLKAAIARHERHMAGTEATDDKSQQKMMDEMRAALEELGSDGVMKRAPALTAADGSGHAHLISDADEPDGFTSWEKAPGSEYGHSHPWVHGPDGSISIGEAEGHRHTLETSMPDDLSKTLAAAQNDLTAARAEIAKRDTRCSALTAALLAAVAMPPDQAAFAKRLPAGELETFLAKSDADRAAVAKPVHVAKSGEVFFASDDPRLVSMAKSYDAQADVIAKQAEAAQLAVIEKSVAAVPVLKGAALLVKAAYLLPEAERATALADLQTINATVAMVTKSVGRVGPENDADPKVVLEKAVEAFAKSHPTLSPIEARREFGGSDEGQRLYAAAYPTN